MKLQDRSLDGAFWAGLVTGVLRIQCCEACDRWTWPPQWRCSRCGSWDMEWRDVRAEGIVHSLAQVYHSFAASEIDMTPYPILLVALPNAGNARLLGRFVGEQAGLAIGASVVADLSRPIDSDHPRLQWRLSETTRR